MFEGKRILITGGTGSWGNELADQLLNKNPREIRILSRGEFAQVMMSRKFNDSRLKFVIGDIRDHSAVYSACRNIDYIFHLAALKHVPICEDQPDEAIKTNIKGTQNLINAAIANDVKKVIDVSTDKAVDPINIYGMTKALAERLVINANKLSDSTRFICIRAGNVLGSNGSIVPYFIDTIKRFNKIIITDKRMTRYFITLKEAINLLFKASENSIGGETFVMQMPSFKIIDLAEILIEVYGNKDTMIEEIGARPGEKIDEVLISKYEVKNTYEYDEKYFIIFPMVNINTLTDFYKNLNLNRVKFLEYNSQTQLLDKTILLDLLKRGGFINL